MTNGTDWLKELIKQKGFSIRQLAKKTDFTHSAIVYFLNGKTETSLRIVLQLAKALEVSPLEIMARLGMLQDELDNRLVMAFCELNQSDKEKVIEFAEFYLKRDE